MPMTFKVTIQSNVAQIRAQLQQFSDRQFAASMATALTRTAVKVRDAVQADMPRVFDRPTPYTVRQLRYVPATADRLAAAVGFNVARINDERGALVGYRDLGPGETPAGKYLQFQVDGGQRAQKRFERALQTVGILPQGWVAVPGERAKIDQYGNQSVGELRQILSFFDAAELVAGSRQNMGPLGRAKRLKGTRKKAGFEYFVVRPGERRSFVRQAGARAGMKGTHLAQPGIYRRTNYALGSRIEPVLIFVKRALYKPRFDFYNQALRITNQTLPGEIDRAVAERLARLQQATP
jgi:hypothetical protein